MNNIRMSTALILILLILILIIAVLKNNFTSIPVDASVYIQFEKEGEIITIQPTDSEAAILRRILSGRLKYREQYSCGFSKSLSIVVDGCEYYVAFDACPFIYEQNTGKFFSIGSKNKQILAIIYSNYGANCNY